MKMPYYHHFVSHFQEILPKCESKLEDYRDIIDS